MTYVPLNVHSQYSILNSTASLHALASKAKEYQISSIALTDEGNLYGAVDFYKACKSVGVKAIFGCEIWMAPKSRRDKKRIPGTPHGIPMILLAKDASGYQNLCKLSSIGFLEGFYYQPRIDKEVLEKHREGLICIYHSTQDVQWYLDLFQDDLYLEIQRHPVVDQNVSEGWLLQRYHDVFSQQKKKNEELLQISLEKKIPLVATNDIHYIAKEDFRAHEILLNIQSGEVCEIWERDSFGNPKNKAPNPKREIMPTRELYFKSPEEMKELFSDLPEALENTLKIAEKCHCDLDFKAKHYPVFIPQELQGKTYTKEERLKSAEKFLYDLCKEGIKTRYTPEKLKKVSSENPLEIIEKRFKYEFEILSSKGMCDYMLIVYDFIAWAKSRKIPMGPGRGSAAGSLIAYLIGITDIEPLRFHLFFERFINPERISYPDIDVDICMERRQEVIDYVVQKYGKDRVAQIITFGTMKAKMAIRDVGRVLNVALSKVNQIAALVPEDPNMTLEKAFQIDPELSRLMETDEEARALLEMAKKAEGSIRNTSTHAAGLIISESPITEHIPVCTAKDSEMWVTQFAMKPVESVGMLKIDFLGLKTLTSIQKCVDAIERNEGRKINWGDLPLDDQKTFDLLNQGKTLGVFQIETGGMADLSRQLHIDMFEEIIAVVALFRPGPMDMIPSYVNRKHGKEPIEIDHPLMKDILSETYGVMVYQEQVMQIASSLAGYSLGEGDVLRRAMGKKDREEMVRQREKFVSGCIRNGIEEAKAVSIFDKIEKFASYGFNKSHAAAYAYLSYATAYFKAHYPKEWMAALMTCDQHDTTKLARLIAEAQSLQIEVLLPDVNHSSSEFSASKEGIRFAMAGIKGVGEGVVEAILEERKKGAFSSLYDLIQRVDKTKVGKKQIELLIEAGAFDFTSWSRDAMRQSVEQMYERSSRDQKEASLGVLNLFSLMEETEKPFSQPPEVTESTSGEQLLQREKELLGFYLTGHPMDGYKKVLGRLSCVPLTEVKTLADQTLFRTAFVVETVQIKISSKNQKKFAILVISDGLERFELPIWADLFEEKSSLLKENQLLYGILQVERKKDTTQQLSCRYIDDLTKVDEERIRLCDEAYSRLRAFPKPSEFRKKPSAQEVQKVEQKYALTLLVDANQIRLSQILKIKELVRAYPGKSTVDLQFFSGKEKISSVFVDTDWGVKIGPSFQGELQKLSDEIGFRFQLTE